MLIVTTPGNCKYEINEQGQIRANSTDEFTDNWKMLGIQKLTVAENEPQPFIPFSEVTPEWRTLVGRRIVYGCGNCRFTIKDVLNTVPRVWGEKQGIKELYFE